MVRRNDINLFKLFKVGQHIKLKRDLDERNALDREQKKITPNKHYRIMAIYRHYLQCIDANGIRECFTVGELVCNGLIGCNTKVEEA